MTQQAEEVKLEKATRLLQEETVLIVHRRKSTRTVDVKGIICAPATAISSLPDPPSPGARRQQGHTSSAFTVPQRVL